MSRDEGAAASLLLAFILGAVSGAALALLYAPATGRETREFLGEKAREGRDRATEATERSKQAINQVGADEPGAACDENVLHTESDSVKKSNRSG